MSKSMLTTSCRFIAFKQSIDHISIPTAFTYPFCYQPDNLSRIAATELQAQLAQHFVAAKGQLGQLFGVLVVKNKANQIGYLAAISGDNAEINNTPVLNQTCVPQVYVDHERDTFVQQKTIEINTVNTEISKREQNPNLIIWSKQLAEKTTTSAAAIAEFRQQMIENRQQRKLIRQQLANHSINGTQSAEAIKQHSIQLSRESVADKAQLAALKAHWQQIIATITMPLNALKHEIEQLKKRRKKLSSQQQKHRFKQYKLLNALGEQRDLIDIFNEFSETSPPVGSGDCAAPKLLQYAFKQQLTPVSLAEFWWGEQPQSVIRKHQYFYPACQHKCQPILMHMLKGMNVDPNPLLINPAANKTLDILYADEHLVVVNKPAGLLAVPGKNIKDSAYSRIKTMFPNATGGLILHRLDMATSGLMMFSLNERAHKNLQAQFINKTINKRYVALLDGNISADSGCITLPLILDIEDRPRQKVCEHHGKYAETTWQVTERKNNQTRVQLNPITGRTHQLRVHCAHPQGLNTPIIGDNLYGTLASRLHLHAQRLSFNHPITHQPLIFEAETEF